MNTHYSLLYKYVTLTLAPCRSEITFEEIQSSVQIPEDEVEEFLIDVIKTKVVRSKISQDDGHLLQYHVKATDSRGEGGLGQPDNEEQ